MGGIGSIGSIGRYFTAANAKRAGIFYLNTMLGTNMEAFTNTSNALLKLSPDWKFWQIGKKYREADFSNFWSKMKQSAKAMETAGNANGGFMKNLWKEFTDIPGCFKRNITDGWKAAAKTSKFGGKLLGGVKGFGKAFMKKMPLIGSIFLIVDRMPDIIAAFKDKENGGFLTGVGEILKSGAKIGLDMGGFIVGQALIPIPFFGGLIGSAVFRGLGNLILGKGYKEKLAAKQQKATQNMVDSNPSKEQQQTNFKYNWQPPQMNNVMDQQQLAYAMNQLYGPNNSLQQYVGGFNAWG